MMIWMFACLDSVDEKLQTFTEHLTWEVSEPGPFQVGYTTKEISYSLLGDERTTLINIWYPTEETQGEAAEYFSIVEDEGAFFDASWAAPVAEDGYPVLVFSHGSFLYGGSSAFLPKHFASHGWVVAAPDHTGHLLSDYGGSVEASTFYLRPYNNSAALDALMSLENIHTDEAILSGFSFGATDNWMNAGAQMNMESITEMCTDGTLPSGCSEEERSLFEEGFLDSRFQAIIPMAGADRFAWISTQGRSNVDIPVLMISGTEDSDSPQTIVSEVQGVELTSIEIEGGCHQLFSVGNCPQISTEEGYSIVQTESLRFARENLFAQ
ncbi:MAG: hypothetical protein CL916_07990 [Deltaproteobacteria bacterium]|nr:hypothetical protein [Deltaproteobacteria bacterium]